MKNLFKRWCADTSGNFGIALAVISVPLILGIGSAIDFGMAMTDRSQLQIAADAAAVGALAEQSVGVTQALTKSMSGEVEVGKKDAEALFKANMDPKLAAYVTDYAITLQKNGNLFTSEVSYKASIPTSFLGIVGRRYVPVSGVAKASYVPAMYIDFYLMLDNSPSMGLGATTDDISVMEKNTSDTCAFACHIENSTNDYYTLAKKLGVTTRIQLVSLAAQAMMTTAKTTRRYSDQYRMSVYSMGAKATNVALTNVSTMSQDMDDVAKNTATIDLMSIPYQGYNNDQQTDFGLMLQDLNKIMGTGGSGLNATDRQKVLFFVSDGVNDSYKSSGCIKQTTGGRCQAPIDYSICTKIKDAGIRIAVLYTTYKPLTKNSWYNTWIKPFQNEINPQMKACASTDLFFEVSPSQGITEAMNALFLKVVNMPRLTG